VTTIGRRRGERTTRPEAAPDALAATRIEAARACRAWTELDPADLFEREHAYVVHGETDEAFLPYRGDAFSPSGLVVSDQTPVAFVVVDGDLLVLERQPQSWSDLLYQRERVRASSR
jgi:hypothetical protein